MKLSRLIWLLFSLIISTLNATLGTFNIDFLTSRADIFYQYPRSTLGAKSEIPIHKIKDFKIKTNLKVIIHGFTGSRFHASISSLGNAYMAKGTDNVFLADWADAAALDYHSSRVAVRKVAKVFGKLLDDFIKRFNIDPTEMHIIGHSLGAHIAGGIGDFFNGTLGRVTGLDPALPLFTPYNDDSLHATAALFVDVIHTDYPIFGDITPRGTVDFYPGYGRTPQKGCDDFDLIAANSCSHNRAVLLYAESIGKPKSFPTLPCSLNAIKQSNSDVCLESLQSTMRNIFAEAITKMDENQIVYMGENISKRAYGVYYLDTYDAPPFGMGINARF